MKKLIPFLVLLVGITGALAQGTVDFNNNRTYQTAADRLVYNVDGSRLVGTNYAAEMYVRSTTGSLTPVIGGAARFRVTTTGSPGTWSGGTRTIPGFLAGETVTLVIRA